MMNNFFPDMYQKSIFDINYNSLKKDNIKCILFDLDNTISPAKEFVLSKKVNKLFSDLKKDFIVILFSNNHKKRVSEIAKFYDVNYTYFSLKPLSYKYLYIKYKYKLNKNEIIAIGDQLVTDVFGAKKLGIKVCLVDPLTEVDAKETFINRKIEKIILKKFEKKGLFKKGSYYEK